MKHVLRLFTLALCFSLPYLSMAQSVGVSGTAIVPDSDALLELRATDKGVLLPRMNSTQRSNYTTAANSGGGLGASEAGMTIFNTSTNLYNYWDGSAWIVIQTVGGTTGAYIDNQNALDQAADFRISGDGTVQGALGVGTQAALGTSRVIVHDASGTAGEIQLLVRDNASLPILTVQDIGRVGIGTSAPAASLEIRGVASSPMFSQRITKNSNIASELTGIGFGSQQSSSVVKSGIIHERISANGTGKLHFLNDNSVDANDVATTETRMTIDQNGNVGIGTTGPARTLEVIGDISLPSSSGNKQIYTWGPTDANWRIGMSANPGFSRNLATSHVEYRTFASGAGQGFAVGDNVTGLSSFEVTGSGSGYDAYFRGDVGIGGNPSYPLHVTKTIGGNWQGRFTNGSSNVYLAHQGGYGMHINTGGTNSSSRYALEVRNASQVHMFVREDGRVGIRNSSPGYDLDVTGNTRTTGDFYGDIHVDDTRNDNFPPTTYNNEVAFDFKNRSVVGVGGSGTYSGMMTIAPWADNSGDASHQINFNEGGLFWRQGQPSNATWGSWDQIMTASTVNSFVNGDNLGNHTATTNLNMNSREIDNITYSDILAGNGYGVRFWQSNSYKIHMGNATEYRYGDVQDYSIKMNMNNDAQGDRGWTWGVDGQVPVASISTAGHMALDGSLFLDCVSCGSTSDPYPTGGSGWGNMVLQGRVMSANSNIHLSPPGGQNVIINDSYRAGGGGTGSGDAGLIVEGRAAIGQTTIDASYQLKVNGRLRTTGINETSDRRFKKDILPISNALNKVLTMEGVTYNWKIDEFPEQNFRDELQHGLIAQDLEKIVPELVLTGSDGYKSIEYTHLVPVLIEALKEQQNIIDSQKGEISEQANDISDLKAESKQMQKTLNSIMNQLNGYTSIDQ